MVALVWLEDVPENEFDSLVLTERYISIDHKIKRLTLVRLDCMDEPNQFAHIFARLIKHAIWNHEVV